MYRYQEDTFIAGGQSAAPVRTLARSQGRDDGRVRFAQRVVHRHGAL